MPLGLPPAPPGLPFRATADPAPLRLPLLLAAEMRPEPADRGEICRVASTTVTPAEPGAASTRPPGAKPTEMEEEGARHRPALSSYGWYCARGGGSAPDFEV